jgi:hypothetical protein
MPSPNSPWIFGREWGSPIGLDSCGQFPSVCGCAIRFGIGNPDAESGRGLFTTELGGRETLRSGRRSSHSASALYRTSWSPCTRLLRKQRWSGSRIPAWRVRPDPYSWGRNRIGRAPVVAIWMVAGWRDSHPIRVPASAGSPSQPPGSGSADGRVFSPRRKHSTMSVYPGRYSAQIKGPSWCFFWGCASTNSTTWGATRTRSQLGPRWGPAGS